MSKNASKSTPAGDKPTKKKGPKKGSKQQPKGRGIIWKINAFILQSVIATAVIAAGLTYCPNYLFSGFPLDPVAYETPAWNESISKWNTRLSGKQFTYLLKDEPNFIGPESLAERGKFIYTGLADGRLVEIEKQSLKVRTVTRFNQVDGCVDGVYWDLIRCGRPLGLRFNPQNGILYVLEASTGLYAVDVTSGEKKLVPLEIPENLRGLYNDFVWDPVLPNVMYISVTSRKWLLDRIVWSKMEHDNSGCVISANLATNKVTLVAEGFYMTNGIEVTDKTLLVSESTAFRISRISLQDIHRLLKSSPSTESKIAVGTLIDELPGEPDNLRIFGTELYVGLVSTRIGGRGLGDLMAPWPGLRKCVGRAMYVVHVVLSYLVNNLYHDPALSGLSFQFYSGHLLYQSVPPTGAVLKLDPDSGEIEDIYGSNTFFGISEVLIDSTSGDMFLGSFRNRFLGLYRSDG